MEIRRERKVITVLFVDLVGFTSMSEAMDPEDVEVALSRYHSDVRTELERFGGTVEKFIGDAVMAIFGAPVAHEDDAERAVRAALAVRDWATSGSGLEVRIGVNTGETLVRLGARAEAGEGIAVGDVVNTTARLQTAAPTNGVIVGEATYRATRSVIDYEETEPITAKGKAEPVPAWIAVDARSRFGVDLGDAPKTKFVGRENELGLLRSSLSRARAEDQPQLVTLVGVPGIGKSRLLHELSRLVEADPELITWRQGRCLPYGDGVSMWALSEIVKAEAGIFEGDAPEVAEQKLIKAVEAQDTATDSDWMVERLRPLIGFGQSDDSRVTRDEQFAAWRQFLENLADDGPAVVIFEDLHWADDTLLDFVNELSEDASGVPLLIVCTARPELLAKRPTWGAGRTNAITLSLQPLPADQTANLVGDILSASEAPPDLQAKILEQAEGNPLYAEEYARMVAEGAAGELGLPDSIQGIIAARLDSLESEHKRLLQLAAVIGKVFWATAVADAGGVDLSAVEEGLHALERRELVRRERRSSLSGVTQYAFRHITTRDVAYGQIPRGDRSLLHQRVAEWLASLGRPEDNAELIAHHYVEAIEFARAAARDVGDFGEAARKALRDAGERAIGLGSHVAAAQYFEAALELSPAGLEHAELLAARGTAECLATSRVPTQLADAVAAFEQLGLAERAAETILTLSRAYAINGDITAAQAWLDTAADLLAAAPDSPVHFQVILARAGVAIALADNETTLELVLPILPDLERLGKPRLLARALDLLGASRTSMADASGLEDQRKAVEIFKAERAVYELLVALNNLGASFANLARLRDMHELIAVRQEAIETYGGTSDARLYLVYAQATCAFYRGEWDDVLRYASIMFEQVPPGSMSIIEQAVRGVRAQVLVARGDAVEAQADLERALAIARSSQDTAARIHLLATAANVLVTMGETGRAQQFWAEATAAATAHSLRVPEEETISVALAAVTFQTEHEMLLRLADVPGQWAVAARAILRHEFAEAADMLLEIGHLSAAAQVDLRAGGANVPRALEFFRSVGAVHFINAIEAGEYS